MPQYFSLVTLNGQGKVAAAIAGGPAVNITHLAVGDGNGVPVTPLETQTALVHEVWRGGVLSVSRDPALPTQVIVTAEIPIGAGPFVVRELALIADDGSVFAVQNTPEIEKSTAAQGATQDVIVHFRVVVATTANITVSIDPASLISVAALMRAPFISIDSFATAPPVGPAVGALVVVGSAPTGAFAGLAHRFAQWTGALWVNAEAKRGTVVHDIATGTYWRRTADGWAPFVATETERGLMMLDDIFIRANITKTIGAGGDFANFDLAYAWARQRIVVADAYVTWELVAGDTALTGNRSYWHAQHSQFVLAGQTVVTLPVPGDFVVTGRNVAGDKSTNRTMLRGKYPSRLLMAGYSVTFAGIGSIRDIMFEGSGAGTESVALFAADGGTVLTRVASCNLSSYGLDLSSGIFRFGSAIALSGCAWNLLIRAATALVASNAALLTYSSGNAGSHSFSSSAEIDALHSKGHGGVAVQVEGTAHFAVFGAAAIDHVATAISPTRGASVEVRGALNVTNCTTNGVHAQDGSRVLLNGAINIAVDSGGIGIFAQSGSLIVGYGAPAISGGAYGIRCDDSDVRMTGTGTAAGTTNDLAAFDGGHISASNVSGTTISPTRGTLGNSNSYIQ